MKIPQHTFIVSGGSSGLGLAAVENLVKAGGHVAVLDLSEAEQLQGLGSKVLFLKTDITNLDQVESAVEQVVRWTGDTGAQLAGVVNAAGVGTAAKTIDAHGEPHSLDLWKFALDVNLTGTFNLSRLTAKHLIKVPPSEPDGERGVIIMVASAAAFEGQPGQLAYSATKGALVSMTLPMARDLGRYGIRVATIAPGIFESAMTQRMNAKTKKSLEREVIFPRRFGLPHEFAETVKWIIECGYVNGETYRISGAGRLPGKL